ncbi:MAG: nuclear transport factor 2 family protein [Micropruina sp.]
MTDPTLTTRTSLVGHPLLARYYAVLTGGPEAYRDGADLLPLLADDFVFEGPIAGRMSGGARFAHGVRGFVERAHGVRIIQACGDDEEAAVLYDAALPGGTVRFAEFFRFTDGRISELVIHYDAAAYLAQGGR